MRPISDKRRLRELQTKISFFTHDTPSKFHLMNIGLVVDMVKLCLRMGYLADWGLDNALRIATTRQEFHFRNLPEAFDGFRILLMTDLHLDGVPGLTEKINEVVGGVEYDICVLGGDYRFCNSGNTRLAGEKLKKLLPALRKDVETLAILGNHDEYEIGKVLSSLGARVLLNERHEVRRGSTAIHFCGVDDCHYYAAHDLGEAFADASRNDFVVFLSHSPELYREAAEAGASLYLAGHTHSGQICLPGGVAVITEAHVPRRMAFGKWRHKGLSGYTSKGVGSSGVAARFNCPPEVVILTLRKTLNPEP